MFTLFNRFGWLLLLLVSIGDSVFTASVQGQTLEAYIQQAFQSNKGLQQQQFNLERSLYALKEARSYYLPQVGFNAGYTRAGGGRTIDIPIGDLLNPVYSTLNRLTASGSFPQVDNASVLLNPDNFYDAKLHTTLPLLNREIGYNKQIKQQAITMQQAAVNVYKRELVKDVRSAYYRYYQAVQAVSVYESSILLLKENVRVNESLLRNGSRNATALLRSRAEQEKAEAAWNQQQYEVRNARAYFNFLLNRELTDSIQVDTIAMADTEQEALAAAPVTQREELTQLKAATNLYDLNTKLQRSNAIPRLGAFLDLGSQAFNFAFNSKSLYYLGGINLQWDLFAGSRNRFKIKQAELDRQSALARYDEAALAFRLQREQAVNQLQTAAANYRSAQSQETLAERYYNDQFKVYKEGQLLYIELVDTQNQLTISRLQRTQARAAIQLALAELERCDAAYPL